MSKILALIVAISAVALVAAGCGSSDDSTTDSTASLTKGEFLKQGNAICAKGNQELEAGFNSFGKEHELSFVFRQTERVLLYRIACGDACAGMSESRGDANQHGGAVLFRKFEAMENGVLAGYEMVDIAVPLLPCTFHTAFNRSSSYL